MAAESDLEKKVRLWCTQNGILTRKFVSPGCRGVPDRMFMKNGKVAFLELKARGKYPTPIQMREIVLIKGHGVPAHWSDNFEDCRIWLTRNLLQ
jgi:hypothetical protein